jgi:hypothetical protein
MVPKNIMGDEYIIKTLGFIVKSLTEAYKTPFDLGVTASHSDYKSAIAKNTEKNTLYTVALHDPQFDCKSMLLRWPNMDVEWRILGIGRLKCTGRLARQVCWAMGAVTFLNHRLD